MIIPVVLPMPLIASGNTATDTAAYMIYKNEIDSKVIQELKLEDNCAKAYYFFKR